MSISRRSHLSNSSRSPAITTNDRSSRLTRALYDLRCHHNCEHSLDRTNAIDHHAPTVPEDIANKRPAQTEQTKVGCGRGSAERLRVGVLVATMVSWSRRGVLWSRVRAHRTHAIYCWIWRGYLCVAIEHFAMRLAVAASALT